MNSQVDFMCYAELQVSKYLKNNGFISQLLFEGFLV